MNTSNLFKLMFLNGILVLAVLLSACGEGIPGSALESDGKESGAQSSPAPNSDPLSVSDFEKSESDILNSLDQAFYCAMGEQGYNLYFRKGGQLQVESSEPQVSLTGSWSIENGKIAIAVPSEGIRESSTQIETGMDLVITFKTPSLSCHTWAHGLNESIEGYFKCETIKWIPTVSYEDNSFDFKPGGHVIRKRFKELIGVDTLVKTSHGVYRIIAGRLYMAFGDRDEERFLNGAFESETAFLINELEPEKGPCRLSE